MQLKLTETKEGVLLDVHVVPRAKRSALVGVHDGRVKVALCAPPVDGAANAELVALFAKLLGCPKRDISLVRGDTSRQKTLLLKGTSKQRVETMCIQQAD